MVGDTLSPPFAIVAKAVVISSKVTSDVPSASDGTGASALAIPAAWATFVTQPRPTPCATRAAGTFRDCSSARRIVTGP